MSRRWLLSLLCLSVLFLSLVQLTRARGEFKVNETTTRILLNDKLAGVMLAVENATGETLNASIQLELLDPRNKSRASTSQTQSISAGSQKLNLALPFSFSNLNEKEKSEFLWYRLHYRVSESGSTGNTITEGIVSLSEITPDLFELRVATSGLAREAGRYYARVKATHPITGQPASDVRIDGEITLEDDNGNTKLRASKTTDSKGLAALDFVIPPRFPQFPHTMRPAGGQIQVVGRKGAIVATTEGQVVVDQFARVLLSSDKPLYQPGQIMHLRALLFTPSKRALANQSAFFKIADPEGITVFQTVATTTRFGVANTDWSIPENTRLGDYRIFAGIDGGDDSSETAIDVRVSRYDLPNFKVNVETDRPYYLPGQNATVKVRADYLFGKPVPRGRVRVVRENGREWNYQEQKWEIDEGETFGGETDATGVYVAHINLASEHEKAGDYYRRFRDATFAAYFTDPTTNRTEQRRFALRATAEPIHVYVIEKDEWVQNKALPLKFFVSTFYADGTPARCSVRVEVSDESSDQKKTEKRLLATLRTNQYGLGKVSGVRLPSEFVAERSRVELIVSAVDSKGRKGTG
ncbi:MAG TPA: MG2 domain-containing protein, partial [Pyrinomonadaceae bacterium]